MMLPFKTQQRNGVELQAWWVVDVARHPYLLQSIYQHEDNPDLHFLYQGTPLQTLREYSPILLRLTPTSALWPMLSLPLWQQNALVIWTTQDEPSELLCHLQSLLFMTVERNLTLIRFYSPATFHALSKSLSLARLALMSGPIQGWDYCASASWSHIAIERVQQPVYCHTEGWFALNADELDSFNREYSKS